MVLGEPEVKEKIIFHPELKRPEPAVWVGWFKHYSQWEFKIDGLTILGEPYKEF